MTVEGMQEMETNWFVFRNLRLDVPVKGQTRTIVDDVSGECKSGECLAILGPSGAGKTSLLNILTLNVASSGSDTYGKCTLNGHRLDQKLFQKHCVFVEQLDNHRAFLTPRQSLRYSLDFYNPESTDAEKDEEVSQLLQKLGLEVCADTKIGNLFIQGLSGGQKKRLSVALALVKKPEVLFLDEPTSGLDAAASSNVIKYIRELARDLNIVVIATVHQPSSSIYMSFQNVMILSSGRTAYFGSPDGSVSYFAKIGHPMPEFSNPAEHILDVVNAEFTSSDQVRTVLNSWAENASSLRRKYGSVDSLLPANVSEEKGAIITDSDTELPWLKELMFVFRRQAHIAMIDPMIYIGRAFGFLFACTFFSIIYVESRERTQEQVLNRLWLSMWFAGVPTSMGVVAVYAYSEEFAMIKKEVKNGMYSLSSYLIASAVLQVPGMLILALAAVGIPGFAVGNMWAPHFAEIISLYLCLYFSYECIARMYSVLFDNPLMGMLGYMNVWFTSFLFAGIMIPEDQVIWPFRALVYVLPLNWSVRTVTYLDSIDAEYDGAYYCDGDVRSDCIYHFDDDGEKILPGWTCSEVADGAYNPMQCFGNEGWQTLDSLGKNYESISSEDETDRNFGIIIAIAATMWTVYVILAYLQVSHVTVIKDTTPPPVAEEKQVSPASSSSSSEQVKKTAVAAVASTTSFEVVTVSESDYEPVAAVP